MNDNATETNKYYILEYIYLYTAMHYTCFTTLNFDWHRNSMQKVKHGEIQINEKKTEKSFSPMGCSISDKSYRFLTIWRLPDNCLTTICQMHKKNYRRIFDNLKTAWWLPDNCHCFVLSLIPKPKPKLVDTFDRYRNRYRNLISK